MIKRKKNDTDVEVPVTPMLDMAFQLMTFFIMTYHPAPAEFQFSMNLLPASPQVDLNAAPSESDAQPNDAVPAALRTMKTSLFANADGSLGRVSVGEVEVQGMDQLRERLQAILADKSLPFDQALIQADPQLKYEELMKVVDIYSKLDITKISFTELGANAVAGAGL
jgi:biopolymer transport protein ExbD